VSALAAEYRARAETEHDIYMQMPVLYAWAHQAMTVIELGVRYGMSTSAFLAGLERADRGGQLWSVDIRQPEVPGEWYRCPFWHLFVGDDVSPAAAAFCPQDADLLFIDTSHYYDHTLAELRLYVPKVRPGGLVLLHDTAPDEWPDVSRALNEYCAETGREWYDHPFWHGLGVMEIARC
jgi:cephalosporin hydroxylase